MLNLIPPQSHMLENLNSGESKDQLSEKVKSFILFFKGNNMCKLFVISIFFFFSVVGGASSKERPWQKLTSGQFPIPFPFDDIRVETIKAVTYLSKLPAQLGLCHAPRHIARGFIYALLHCIRTCERDLSTQKCGATLGGQESNKSSIGQIACITFHPKIDSFKNLSLVFYQANSTMYRVKFNGMNCARGTIINIKFNFF